MGYSLLGVIIHSTSKLAGGKKLEHVKWNSGFLQNTSLLWSLQMLRLVAFLLPCGMRGGKAVGVCVEVREKR